MIMSYHPSIYWYQYILRRKVLFWSVWILLIFSKFQIFVYGSIKLKLLFQMSLHFQNIMLYTWLILINTIFWFYEEVRDESIGIDNVLLQLDDKAQLNGIFVYGNYTFSQTTFFIYCRWHKVFHFSRLLHDYLVHCCDTGKFAMYMY